MTNLFLSVNLFIGEVLFLGKVAAGSSFSWAQCKVSYFLSGKFNGFVMVKKSEYHKNRTAEALELRKKFAVAYNNLLRDRLRSGRNLAGIKLMAATLAGFGANSFTETAAYKTRRTMASRMMSDELVISELKKLGLKPHPIEFNEWVVDDIKSLVQSNIEDF